MTVHYHKLRVQSREAQLESKLAETVLERNAAYAVQLRQHRDFSQITALAALLLFLSALVMALQLSVFVANAVTYTGIGIMFGTFVFLVIGALLHYSVAFCMYRK